MAARGMGQDVVAHVGGGVDADGPLSHLRDGHDVGESALGDPSMGRDHLRLDEGQHRIASADGEGADQEEGPEQVEEKRQRFHFFSL